MSKWRTMRGVHGSTVYRKDNRIVATKKVPINIVELLKTKNEVDDTLIPDSPNLKPCIFCGEHSKFERILDMQTVYLCSEHYYSKTIGQVAHKLRRIPDERNEQAQEGFQENVSEKNEEGEGILVAA